MKVKETIKKVEESKKFNDWKKNKDFFLAHVFVTFDSGKKDFEVGYYNKKDLSMACFRLEPEISLQIYPEIFKKEETKIQELDIKKVKISLDNAVEKADNLQKEKYPAEASLKKIAILQHIEEGLLWNITYFTQTLKTLNIKIDAQKGNIISEKLVPVIQFGSGL